MAQAQEVFLFQPTSVPGCQLWLDAADVAGTGAPTANGSSISTWVDKSGNGRNATTSVAPTYDAAARYILFNGTSQFFTLPNGTYPFGNTPYSIFIVAYTRNASNPQWVLAGGNESTNQAIGLLFYTTNAVWHSWWVNEYRVDNSIVNNVPSIVNISYSTTRSIIVNGGTASVNSPGAVRASPNTSNYIGRRPVDASQFFDGGMAECIVYNSEIPTSQRQQIEGYLAWKWGLQASLPANHPFKTYRPLAQTPIPTAIPPMPLATQSTPVFVPSQVPNINAWYDGADPLGTGIVPTFNTSLSTWVDKSGNGRNASGGTSPTFVSGGVSFNGSSQFYNISIPYSSNYSIFLVATNTTAAQCYYFSRSTVGAGQPTFIQGYIGAGIGLEWYEGNDRATIATTPLSPFIASVDHTQGGRTLGWYYGNQAFDIPQAQGYQSAAWDRLGQAGINVGWYGGTMKDVIFYSNVVTTSQRQQIEGYLAWKWGLQNNLPNNHPYKTIASQYSFGFVRRPPGSLSVWRPTLLSGVQLWLDATDVNANGTSVANGATVSQWSDKSGSNNNTTSALGTSTYTATIINNKPAVTFNSSAFRGNLTYTGTQLHTFVVMRMAQNGAYPRILSMGNVSQNDFDTPQTCIPFTIDNGTTNLRVIRNNTAVNVSFPAFNTPFLGVSAQYANTQEIGVNGQITPNTTSTGTSASFNISQFGIGVQTGPVGEQTFIGHISEILVYNTYLPRFQRQQVEGYLAWKWGLVGNLPSNHPYKLWPPSP